VTVNFILNGEDAEVQTGANTRLLDILRDNFKLMGAKAGCRSGNCGVCFVIVINRENSRESGRVMPSCLIPAFHVRGREVITIEGFSQNNEYQDIIEGFSQAGVENCGYCDSAKILVTEALLEQTPRPSRQEILAAFRGIRCRCTDPESLVEGVLAAAETRRRRVYGRSS
jgi:carbon-monoxide dehydrogenase small subunit